MAGKIPENDSTSDPLYNFERVEQNIRSYFDIILQTVEERRDQLLEQLHNIKSEYLKKEEKRKSNKKDLEKMLQGIIDISIRGNLIADMRLEQLGTLEDNLDNLRQPNPIPFPVFRTEDVKTHLQQLNKIGSVETCCFYCTKGNPSKSVGKGMLDQPFGICLDQDETLYVCDCGNRRVQIISKDGEFLSEFGKGQLDRPHGIAVNNEYVFVADWELNTVFKYQKSDHKLAKKSVGLGLHSPKDLTFDKSGDLLVADCRNHRVVVLNGELEFVREMGRGTLKYPCGVRINLNKIYVIDYGKLQNIHAFSQNGDHLHSMINVQLCTSLITKSFGRHRLFLCFDQFGNIIVSATDDKLIQIFTIEGNLLHSIKCEGYPAGIAVNKDDMIVCAMFDPSSIKFY